MAEDIAKFLTREDPALGRLISRIGNFELQPNLKTTVFESFSESIIYQQLHGKAAASIFKKFKALFPRGRISAAKLLEIPTQRLRACGLSAAKAASIQDLAEKIVSKRLPGLQKIETFSDEKIIELFSEVRGIGPWTVEMFLIFKLGRPNVLPATDYAIRKAFSQLLNLMELAPPKRILDYGERWKPHRTAAAWYLWRSLDTKK